MSEGQVSAKKGGRASATGEEQGGTTAGEGSDDAAREPGGGSGSGAGEQVKAGEHFVLIDVSGYIYRAYHKVPPMVSPAGVNVNSVRSFCVNLMRLLYQVRAQPPPRVRACLDHWHRREVQCVGVTASAVVSVSSALQRAGTLLRVRVWG